MIFEDKDLSWQEFIHDKIFFRQKMPEISLLKYLRKEILISISNFYNKNFHDTTFMIKSFDKKVSWQVFFMTKIFLTKNFSDKVFWWNNIYDKKNLWQNIYDT